MVFKDVIDNFIAPLYFNQCDEWEFILAKLTVIEGNGVECVEYDSVMYQFEETIFDPQNWLEGWPAGVYDNYILIPERLELKPRGEYGRYEIRGVLISPWLTTDKQMFNECMDELLRDDIFLYNDVKRVLEDEKASFLWK